MYDVVLGPHVERDLQVVVPLQVERLRAADPTSIVGQPYHWRRRKELGGVQDASHLLCMVCERERRQVRWRIGVGARCALRRREVIQSLRFWQEERRGQSAKIRGERMLRWTHRAGRALVFARAMA